MSKIFSIIIMLVIISCNGQNQKNTKGVVLSQNIKNNQNIPDSFISKIRDTGIIKIGYDSNLTTKLFEYVLLKDLSFDNGKLKLEDTINKLPYKLKKVAYNNGADEDFLVIQTHYYFTKSSFVIKGTLNEGQKNELEIVSAIIIEDTISNSICNLSVGDSITKIPKYFKYEYESIRIELDTSIKNKQPQFGNERIISIKLKKDKYNNSIYWLRYICDINTKKIIRIEAGY